MLNERARNPGQYSRNLLRVLFTSEEFQSSLLPSTQSKRYLKPELDNQRMDLLHRKTSQLLFVDENMFSTSTFCFLDALRARYRIGRHHYDLFYTERIQASLAACVYNEGRRKSKNQSSRDTNHSRGNDEPIIQSASSIHVEREE